MELLLTPPLAFLIYIAAAALISAFGRMLAGPSNASEMKSSTYASGEEASSVLAAPGYRPFFVVALFFAVLHLGVLVMATGGLTPVTGVYLAGLIFALIALILG